MLIIIVSTALIVVFVLVVLDDFDLLIAVLISVVNAYPLRVQSRVLVFLNMAAFYNRGLDSPDG